MGLFDRWKKPRLNDEIFSFCKNNQIVPDFGNASVQPRTTSQILTFFRQLPGWNQVSSPVLNELSQRVGDRSRLWLSYDVDHALETLILSSISANILESGFIAATNNITESAAKHLFDLAVAFSSLSENILGELDKQTARIPYDQQEAMLATAKSTAEAAIICDRYFIPAFLPLARSWSHDRGKAVHIIDEGMKWSQEIITMRPHQACSQDEYYITNPRLMNEPFEQAKQIILSK